MRVMFIGDIVGTSGCLAVEKCLRELCEEYSVDMVLANGENSCANGRGMSRRSYEELSAQGIAAFSLGNHMFDNKELFPLMQEHDNIISPANYHSSSGRRGYTVLTCGGERLALINLAGQVYLSECISPFTRAKEIIAELSADIEHIIIDIHAEATSEKGALAWFLDGRVSAVLGTHTHVQTNDARLLPKGTAFITDVGMTGARDSVLGMDKDLVLRRFTTQGKVRLEVAEGDLQFNAVLLDLTSHRRAKSIQIINRVINTF